MYNRQHSGCKTVIIKKRVAWSSRKLKSPPTWKVVERMKACLGEVGD